MRQNAVTLLTARGRYHAKSFRAVAPGILERVTTAPPGLHEAEELQADSLEEFFGLYCKHLRNPLACFVRGELTDEARSRRESVSRRREHLRAVPRRWFVVDVDDATAFQGVDVRRRPEESVGVVLARLEESPTWRRSVGNADIAYSLSSSAALRKGEDGFYTRDDGVIKCHLIVWLEEPVSDEELRTWGGQVNDELETPLVDVQANVFNQPLFGPPRLLGLEDWLETRHGLLRRGRPSAPSSPFRLQTTTPTRSSRPTTTSAPSLPPDKSSELPSLSDDGRRYMRKVWRDILRTLEVPDEEGNGRGDLLRDAAKNISKYYAAARVEDELGALSGLEEQLVSHYRNKPRRECERNVRRGRDYGLSRPANMRPRLLQAAPSAPDKATRRPLSEELLRREVERATSLERLKERTGVVILEAPGIGKSTIKRQRAKELIEADGSSVVLLVSKDRAAALEDAEKLSSVKGRGGVPVALVGRRRLPMLNGETAWSPRVEYDDAGRPTDASTCGRSDAGSGRHLSCGRGEKLCPMHATCNDGGGYVQRRRQADALLQYGGVVVCTPQLVPLVLSRHEALKARSKAGRLRLAWFDDAPLPTPSRVTTTELRREADKLRNEVQRELLVELANTLEQTWSENKSDDRDDVDGATVRRAVAHLSGHEDDLREVGRRLGAPSALQSVFKWLTGGADGLGALVRNDEDGVGLEVYPPPLNMPDEAAVVVSNATADVAAWEGYTRRPLLSECHEAELHDGHRALHLKQRTFSKSRLRDAPESFDKAAAPSLEKLNEELSSLAELLGRPPSSLRVLVVAHRALITSELWSVVRNRLTARYDTHTIHWRGVAQVGSNAYKDFDAAVLLDTPRMNLGAHRRRTRALRCWRALVGLEALEGESCDEDARGVMEQAVGRLRLVIRRRPLFVGVVAGVAPRTVERLTRPTTAYRPTGRPGGKVGRWLSENGFEALSQALTKVPDGPARSTLQAAYKADTSPEWVVVVEGQRGRGQRWKGPTEGHVRRSVELLLRRVGRGVRPFQVRRADALTEGLKYDRKPCNNTSPRTFRPLNDDERTGLEPSNDALPLRPSGQVREEELRHRVTNDKHYNSDNEGWLLWFHDSELYRRTVEASLPPVAPPPFFEPGGCYGKANEANEVRPRDSL